MSTPTTQILHHLQTSQVYDFARLASNSDLKAYLEKMSKAGNCSETLQFSELVEKVNKHQAKQQRILILTNEALYNFKPKAFKEAQRRIPLKNITSAVISQSSNEVVFQVADDYDYRFVIKNKAELLRIFQKYTPSLLVTTTEEKELKGFAKTKQDVQKANRGSLKAAEEKKTGSSPRPQTRTLSSSISQTGPPESDVGNKPQIPPQISEYIQSSSSSKEGWLTKQKGKKGRKMG